MSPTLVPVATFATRRAFSLVEVVIALGVVTFCLIALMGLLSVGAQASHDSSEVVQAATMASYMISEIRAAPTNVLNATPTFPILPLTNATPLTNSVVYVAPDCTLLTGAQTNQAGYRLTYSSTLNANNTASLYLCLSWPSAVNPTVNPGEVKGRYELFTVLPLQ